MEEYSSNEIHLVPIKDETYQKAKAIAEFSGRNVEAVIDLAIWLYAFRYKEKVDGLTPPTENEL